MYILANGKSILRVFYLDLNKTEIQHCRVLLDSFLIDMYNREKIVLIQAWGIKRGNSDKNHHSSFEFYSGTSMQVQCHFCDHKCYLPVTGQWRRQPLLSSAVPQLDQALIPVWWRVCTDLHRDSPITVSLWRVSPPKKNALQLSPSLDRQCPSLHNWNMSKDSEIL